MNHDKDVRRQEVPSEEFLVEQLQEAHREALSLEEQLAAARRRRREAGWQLRVIHRRAYRWIGEQISVSAQAVEGFLKYPQRRKATNDQKGTNS